MTKCFEDNIECTELVLQIIMEKSDLKVTEARTQYTIKNLQGRSIRLDVDAVDSKGKKYNIDYSDFRIIPIKRFKMSNLLLQNQFYRNNYFCQTD